MTALEAIPGTLIGLAAIWFEGVRRERATGIGPDGLTRRYALEGRRRPVATRASALKLFQFCDAATTA